MNYKFIKLFAITVCFGATLLTHSDSENAKAYYDAANIEAHETVVMEPYITTPKIKEPEIIELMARSECGIFINNRNAKINYQRNDKIDMSGIEVMLLYDTGETEMVSLEECTIQNVDMSTCGRKEIVVSYCQYSDSFYIEVGFEISDLAPSKKYATTALNMRSGPGTEFEIVTSVPAHKELIVTGRADNGWFRVMLHDKEYYCSGLYLQDQPPVVVELAEEVEFPRGSDDMSGLSIEEGVSNDCIKKAVELYSKVPQNVKDAIINSGYEIIVSVSSELTGGNAGTYWYTYPEFKPNKIGIYATSVWKVDIAVIHEIGHFIDNYMGYHNGYGASETFHFKCVSSCDEWKEIYEAEVRESGFPSWTNYCPEEYFAECVWKALAEPEWCRKVLPRSYEFVINIINSVEVY